MKLRMMEVGHFESSLKKLFQNFMPSLWYAFIELYNVPTQISYCEVEPVRKC